MNKAIIFEQCDFSGSYLSLPHLVDNKAKKVVEQGWNIMCERTLPSFLVYFRVKVKVNLLV